MISVSNHEFVELRHQQPQTCKTHFVFTDIDIADLDIPEISSAKYQLKNGNAIGAYKKDTSDSSIASMSRSKKGKKIVAITVIMLGLILLGAGKAYRISIFMKNTVLFCFKVSQLDYS